MVPFLVTIIFVAEIIALPQFHGPSTKKQPYIRPGCRIEIKTVTETIQKQKIERQCSRKQK